MQHFHGKDWTVLTCSPEELPSAVKLLSKQDIESVRKLPSVRKHIESLSSRSDQIAWLTDDKFVKVTSKNVFISNWPQICFSSEYFCFKAEIVKLLTNLHEYIHAFFATLKCLNILTSNLPGAPLEKQVGLISACIFKSSLQLVLFIFISFSATLSIHFGIYLWYCQKPRA